MKHLILILFISIWLQPVFSSENQKNQQTFKELHFKLAAHTDAITEFIVKIPIEFSKLCDISNDEILGYEFIPENENFENWNEIITVLERITIDLDIKSCTDIILNNYQDKKSSIEIIKTPEKNKALEESIFLIDIPSIILASDTKAYNKNKNEIIATKIIQGNFSLITLQYTIKYDIEKTSNEQKNSLKKKALEFLDKNKIGLTPYFSKK